jgi:hypothetical protein
MVSPTSSPLENGCPVVAVTGVLNPNHSRNLQRGDATVFNVFDTMGAVARFNPRTARQATARELAAEGRPAESTAGLQSVYSVPRPRLKMPLPADTHDFYAKVRDEKGQPVAGAVVEIQVRRSEQTIGREDLKASSDAQGLIKLPGLTLGLWPVCGPDKRGYLGDPAFTHYISFGVPGAGNQGMSAADAEVWRLWKKKGPPQPVVSALIAVECPPDGTPVSVNLLRSAPRAGVPLGSPGLPAGKPADLKVSITRAPEDKFTVRKPWNFSVEAPSGGLAETADSLMYLAPEGGYRPRVGVTGQRGAEVTRRVFLKTRDGSMYGGLVLTISAISDGAEPDSLNAVEQYHPSGEIQINYVLNPTGSRSLEPDPKRTYETYGEYLKAEKQK